MTVLGIETSCDETAAAICRDKKIISTKVFSQEIHNKHGGVVPEIASREHEKNLNQIVNSAVKEADISLSEIDGIAVTQGPGLSGALIAGVSFAKGLSLGLSIPIIGINHLEAHIFANFLAEPTLKFPFICLLVSGGHTQIWYLEGIGKYELIGETRDDAAGEAFDKGARILGLGYPGGPEIERLAKSGIDNAINFPRALMRKKNLEFSFSGLKTSLLYFMDKKEKNEGPSLADVAASYQMAIVEVLIKKLEWALIKKDCNVCVIAGGVAANKSLRYLAGKVLKGRKIIFPKPSLCTDNAAMVAFLGELYIKMKKSDIDFSIYPNMRL